MLNVKIASNKFPGFSVKHLSSLVMLMFEAERRCDMNRILTLHISSLLRRLTARPLAAMLESSRSHQQLQRRRLIESLNTNLPAFMVSSGSV